MGLTYRQLYDAVVEKPGISLPELQQRFNYVHRSVVSDALISLQIDGFIDAQSCIHERRQNITEYFPVYMETK